MKDTSGLSDSNLFKQSQTSDEALIELLTILEKGKEFLASMSGNFVIPDELKQSNMYAMMTGFDATRQMLLDWLSLPEIT